MSKWTFGPGDKVMQVANGYEKDVFNGDLGVPPFLLVLRSPLRAEVKRARAAERVLPPPAGSGSKTGPAATRAPPAVPAARARPRSTGSGQARG